MKLLEFHSHRQTSHCLPSFNYTWAQMNHSWILCQQTKTADDKYAADGREQTNVVFLCLSRCINLRRPRRENDLSGAGRQMKCWGDLRALWAARRDLPLRRRLLSALCEHGAVGGTVSSIHPSPTDPVSKWPLPWVTHTLKEALRCHRTVLTQYALWRFSNKCLMFVSYTTDKKMLAFY